MTYHDPVTGDEMSLGEHISWIIQGVIRRWFFLILITIATIIAWLLGTRIPQVLIWWNLAASYVAVMIESIVGIAMFSQTRRDAVVLRKIDKLAEHISNVTNEEEADIEEGVRRLVAEDERILEVMEHLNRQDKMIFALLRKLDITLNGGEH